ncbi:hypothetical protein BDP55DRAFT_647816 [Colletotrichum godetiae]|uniref:Secreted protein n=1 Tax=Colletotrichum godetiae TaxID=1209918 RepID=A0AAJ0AVJ9_9PEZI|nr:uncharacterized protein BDP55DRAFT_647816 [Colletotrichum godetiae]KAK1690608.1 hypothetical protein BDP55DRAFT_647816 [Colletotrichum godetiae]
MSGAALEAPFFLFALVLLLLRLPKRCESLLRFVHKGDGTTVIHLVGYWALVGSLEELWLARGRKKRKGEHSHFRCRSPDGNYCRATCWVGDSLGLAWGFDGFVSWRRTVGFLVMLVSVRARGIPTLPYLDPDEKACRPNKTSEGTEGKLTGRGGPFIPFP